MSQAEKHARSAPPPLVENVKKTQTFTLEAVKFIIRFY